MRRRATLLVTLWGLWAAVSWAQDRQPWVLVSTAETDAGLPGERHEILIFHDGLLVDEAFFTQPRPIAQLARGAATASELSQLALSLAAQHVRLAQDCNMAFPPTKPGFPPSTAVLTARVTWLGRPGQQNTFTVTTSADPPAPLCSLRETASLGAIYSLYAAVLGQGDTVFRQYPPPAP